MKLELKRVAKKETYTIGKLYIDGKYFCDTIEDKDRALDSSMSEAAILAKKIKHQTAIPTGTYKVGLTISPRFKTLLPLLYDVKGFSGIRIHSGNTAEDSSGCIIVGTNDVVGKVLNSRTTMQKLLSRMKLAKGNITITIK